LSKNKPSLGQNFLTDTSATQRIVDALGDMRGRLVIEVGPGGGAITDLLAARAGTLVAIELDRTLAPALRERFATNPGIHVLQQDILQTDLSAIAAQYASASEKALLVGNLPYYITSDILLHLVDHADALELAVVMMQREVAERVAAVPGTREFGMLSATMQMAARTEALFTLPPASFHPPPDVHSTVVRMTMRPRYAELGVERMAFERFLRFAFAQKRKTLARNLRNAGYESERLQSAMSAITMDGNVRAEACELEQMAALFRALSA
jgi:16S rRNA (adenine1518-N6/adenine1519-N6)-dimethyltransferase